MLFHALVKIIGETDIGSVGIFYRLDKINEIHEDKDSALRMRGGYC